MWTCTRSAALALLVAACSSNNSASPNDGGATSPNDTGAAAADALVAKNPDTAPIVSIDRFSDSFAHLFKRSANPSFPALNAPIDFDQGPFITRGLGPNGEKVAYYNFDVLPASPVPIYVFFTEGSNSELTAQLHIIDLLPGDPGYNDFWLVTKVTVPASYVPNSVTSAAEIQAAGFQTTPTNTIVNCPVVPDGSTASLRYTSQESAALVRGWYKGKIVKYFSFLEHMLTTGSGGGVTVAPIYVTFNVNPDPNNAMSGPPSGFKTEPSSMQTHNVVDALPEDAAYSPLWMVIAYDNAAFASVNSLATAQQAPVLVPNAGLVNCPIVSKTAGDGG
ncbi:MAG: hypothetical protein M3O46_22955 [Myxococcota bacterium]|nr:hypothetical protein [Myxococcota bacterium]